MHATGLPFPPRAAFTYGTRLALAWTRASPPRFDDGCRLAALVPRPRAHQHTYHGVLAPAAAYRDLIVPGSSQESAASNAPSDSAAPPSEASAQRATWADLLKRVFAIDVLECPHCGGRRRLIALISDGVVVRKILDHLGLPTEPPRLAPAGVSEELAFDM